MDRLLSVLSVSEPKKSKKDTPYRVITLSDKRNYAWFGEVPEVNKFYDCMFAKNGNFDNLKDMRPAKVDEALPSGVPDEPMPSQDQEAIVLARDEFKARAVNQVASEVLANAEQATHKKLCPACKIIVSGWLA